MPAPMSDRCARVVAMAPHVMVEDISVESIAAAKVAYETTDLPPAPRALSRATSSRRSGAGTTSGCIPDFRAWNIEEYLAGIACPVLAIQGERRRVRHDGAGRGASRALVARRRSSGARGLPPLAAPRPAAGGDRGDHAVRRSGRLTRRCCGTGRWITRPAPSVGVARRIGILGPVRRWHRHLRRATPSRARRARALRRARLTRRIANRPGSWPRRRDRAKKRAARSSLRSAIWSA